MRRNFTPFLGDPDSVRALVLTFVSGGITVLAFAPFYAWFIPFGSLLLLVHYWSSASTKVASKLGFAFGLGMFLFGTSWVYNSLSVYGGMPLWMGAIAVTGFASLMGLFVAFAGWLAAISTAATSAARILCIPLAWVIAEWLKSWVLTGFPWLDIGYSQTETVLFNYAPVGGVYLIGFAVALMVSLAYLVMRSRRIHAILAFCLIPILAFGLGRIDWGYPVGDPLSVGVVQPNTPIEQKWGLAYRNQVLTRLRAANAELIDQGPIDLIVWPETALPALISSTNNEFWDQLKPSGGALLTGIVDRIENQDQINDYNAAILVCEAQTEVYRKRHLVPFGEYLPLRFLFQWVLDYLELPMSDFSSWPELQQLHCGDLRIGLSICYEDAFADEHRVHSKDATMLVNISEDAWFGDSFAPHQRLQMARMRAKELALPLVRSANSGPSVFIDPNGTVVSATPAFESAVLYGTVQPQTGATPFRMVGSWIVYLSLVLLGFRLLRLRFQ